MSELIAWGSRHAHTGPVKPCHKRYEDPKLAAHIRYEINNSRKSQGVKANHGEDFGREKIVRKGLYTPSTKTIRHRVEGSSVIKASC